MRRPNVATAPGPSAGSPSRLPRHSPSARSDAPAAAGPESQVPVHRGMVERLVSGRRNGGETPGTPSGHSAWLACEQQLAGPKRGTHVFSNAKEVLSYIEKEGVEMVDVR